MIAIMVLHGAPLKTPATPIGILDLEFAGKVERAKEIFAAWQPSIIPVAINNTLIDFLFLISYGCLLYACCLSLSKTYEGTGRKTGIIISRLALISAAFDGLENFLMLRTLYGNIQKEVVATTYIFASAKFLLVAVAIIYILFSLVRIMFKRKSQIVTLSLFML